MQKVLFITNELFINEKKPEGGVRLCTYDFIKLLKCRYEVLIFPLQFNRSLIFRLKAKLGLDIYEDYNLSDFKDSLFDYIKINEIETVFINLSNASAIAKGLKNEFSSRIKIILCSHGNESGDFIHQSVRFKKYMPFIKRVTSSWRLGTMLKSELKFRLNYFDLVLTVSEVEYAIEKWLGAKKVYFIPRVFSKEYVSWNPVIGRLGFIGDVSHYPNYFGLLSLCEAIVENKMAQIIHIRIVGKAGERMKDLLFEYKFLFSAGYLEGEDLIEEVSTWMFFLNPVFYYSKGVSTKLAKGMNWGLPVLSTEAGNRGYVFKRGGPVTCDNASEMLQIISSRIENVELLKKDSENVKSSVEAFCDYNVIMDGLFPVIKQL